MIYMKLMDGRELLILEPGNLERLQQGKIGISPDGRIAFAYTPDMPWLSTQLTAAAKNGSLNSDTLARLVEESAARAPIHERPSHPTQQVIRRGEYVKEDA